MNNLSLRRGVVGAALAAMLAFHSAAGTAAIAAPAATPAEQNGIHAASPAAADAAAANAAASKYRVRTAGGPLAVRSGPGTTHRKVATVKNGAWVPIACQSRGQFVRGTFGRSNVWDQIGPGRFIADAYVYTGHDGQFRPTCKAVGVTDDYPYRGQDEGTDPWLFFKGQCTSFVAWRLNSRAHVRFHNHYRGAHFGNAKIWDEAARRVGFAVDKRPTVGSVAQWNRGRFGHVAWVSRVNGNGTILIEEYNKGGTSRYTTRTLKVSQVDNFIHIR